MNVGLPFVGERVAGLCSGRNDSLLEQSNNASTLWNSLHATLAYFWAATGNQQRLNVTDAPGQSRNAGSGKEIDSVGSRLSP